MTEYTQSLLSAQPSDGTEDALTRHSFPPFISSVTIIETTSTFFIPLQAPVLLQTQFTGYQGTGTDKLQDMDEDRQVALAIEMSKETAALEGYWSSLFESNPNRKVLPILVAPCCREDADFDSEEINSTSRKNKAKPLAAFNVLPALLSAQDRPIDEDDFSPVESYHDESPSPVTTSELRLLEHLDLFLGVGNCQQCGDAFSADLSYMCDIRRWHPMRLPPKTMVYITCAFCDTTYCRACWQVALPSKNCQGSNTCSSIELCCPSLVAIAFYLILSAFDSYFLSEAPPEQLNSREGRRSFTIGMLHDLDTHSSPQKLFVETLQSVTKGLGAYLPDNEALNPETRETIQNLLSLSIYHEVIETCMHETEASYLTTNVEVYLDIVSLLTSFYRCGLGSIMEESPNIIRTTEGLATWVWSGPGSIIWEMDRKGRILEGLPLTTAFVDLESRRNELRASSCGCDDWVLDKKINQLCDDISYLLLQSITYIPYSSSIAQND